MSDLIAALERRRMEIGLTQTAVASRLGITQPHYSKVVGGVVRLAPELAAKMRPWLEEAPAAIVAGRDDVRITALARSIERQMRELTDLLSSKGAARSRRAPQATKMRD